MTKSEFILSLSDKLSGLPQTDVEERLSFYIEMIDDRIEEGLTEAEAVLAVGSVDDLASQIIADIPFAKIAKEKIKTKRRLKVWEFVLLAIGSPIWVSLLIALFAVILSVYVSIWSVVISLWSVFVSLIGGSFGSIVAGIVFVCSDNLFSGIAMLGTGIFCAGLSIFTFFGCKAVTNGILSGTKKLALSIKKCFIKREEA